LIGVTTKEERCVQLNAQAINVILSTFSAEVLDEAIFNGQTPPESAHLIWTRLVDLYGKSKCDEAYELESMEDMSIESSYSGETSRNQRSIKPELEEQAASVGLSSYWMCQVWPWQQNSKPALAMMIKLGGGQV
jgi:hypothetical protein